MLPQCIHEKVPFIIGDDFLGLVVRKKALIFHVRLVDEVAAVFILFLPSTATTTSTASFL